MQEIPVSLLTLVAGAFVTVLSIWLGQNHSLLPVQASAQAPLVDGFFNIMFSIAIALFLIVEGTILIFAVKYRRRKGDDTDGVHIEGNLPLEVFWTAIPSIIVLCLGIYSVDVFTRMGGIEAPGHMMAMSHSPSHVAQMPGTALAATLSDTSAGDLEIPVPPAGARKIGIGGTPQEQGKVADLVVDVTGMQFAWIFNYPDGVNSGELHVPVGADVQINLSATDVIHSFWVPQFRLKQDAIPGIPTQLRFVATKIGTYPIVCTELCGGYHGSMRSQVIVQTKDEYDSWLTENKIAQKQELNQAVAVKPAELSTSEFLAPYAHDMGISSITLESLVNGY